MQRTALITGGNRGIGLETCRALADQGLRVILTARDPALGEEAVAGLQATNRDVRFEPLDVASEDSLRDCGTRLRSAGVHIDVLVNNAAIYPQNRLLTAPPERLQSTIETNFLGPVRLCRAFVPAMVQSGYGRVVNVSSGYGAFSDGLDGPALYCLTKAALNAATLILSQEVTGDVKINAACPGWVRTRMGGSGANRSVEQGADTIVWLATLPKSGPTGGFFRDRKRIEW
jgi:NAD(P)-dependent dehydrogenase (short-subunit alcohol dehydrogenase family)